MRQRNHALNGDADLSSIKGNFWDLSGPLKNIGSFCCDVCSKRDHSVLSNGMTYAMQPFIKLLRPRVSSVSFTLNSSGNDHLFYTT